MAHPGSLFFLMYVEFMYFVDANDKYADVVIQTAELRMVSQPQRNTDGSFTLKFFLFIIGLNRIVINIITQLLLRYGSDAIGYSVRLS